jgi:purine nucleoside permease/dienelactone hydrolase
MTRVCLALALAFGVVIATPAAGTRIPVKIVVVTMFERGADSGDEPGELQYWVERNHLDRVIPFPQGYHDLRMNSDGVLAVLTGVGTAKSAAAIMALGMDPRFDLSKAYWLVAGIAGMNPNRGSLGSAAWAEWVVDGDLAREIDAREIPADWNTGYLPLRGSVPYEQPRPPDEGEVYHLNPRLVEWALDLTRNVPLADSQAMQTARNQYESPDARRPPTVMKGDTLSSGTFWHGALLNQWATDWVRYQTGGKGDFVTTAMEDTGTLQSLTLLAKAKRVDLNRVLVLRTASNYDLPPRGVTPAENLTRLKLGKGYTAYLPALEAAWSVGNTVVAELLRNWPKYRDTIPASSAQDETSVEFAHPGAKPLLLDLHIPDGAGPFPAAILVHGGGFDEGSRSTNVAPLFAPLANAQFAWFSIDYRLAPEAHFSEAIADVDSAIQWVKAHAAEYGVDPHKIVIIGESAGGLLVNYAGTHETPATSIAAVVDFYGPVEYGTLALERRDHPERFNMATINRHASNGGGIRFFGVEQLNDAGLAKLHEISPIAGVHSGMPPFLCIHGTKDDQVSYEQSTAMCASMGKVGASCELITIEGGGHGMSGWRAPEMQHWKPEMIAWLRKTLALPNPAR